MSHEPRERAAGAKRAWGAFLDTYEPLRPDLYRYCRHLTRSPWDAEDMAQEALARAFVTLACMDEPPANPRAWLFRVASNLWLNRVRGAREVPASEATSEPSTESEPQATREAAGTLLAELAPQERAAVVLKDVFDFALDEIATALATSTGAIKSALHRGRSKLKAPAPAGGDGVVPPVLDAFCEAFNARDLDRLTALLLDSATMEFPGLRFEEGVAAIQRGSLGRTLFGCEDGGYSPALVPRSEARAHRGEAILLWWWGSAVHAIVRVGVEGGRIAWMRDYHHAPDVITEVCRELGAPFLTHGYRPAPPPE